MSVSMVKNSRLVPGRVIFLGLLFAFLAVNAAACGSTAQHIESLEPAANPSTEQPNNEDTTAATDEGDEDTADSAENGLLRMYTATITSQAMEEVTGDRVTGCQGNARVTPAAPVPGQSFVVELLEDQCLIPPSEIPYAEFDPTGLFRRVHFDFEPVGQGWRLGGEQTSGVTCEAPQISGTGQSIELSLRCRFLRSDGDEVIYELRLQPLPVF